MNTPSRRQFLLASLVGGATLAGLHAPAHAASGVIYVFPVTNVRPHALQKMFSEQMPGIDVKVFGRVGDFSRAIESSRPDAVLALAPVLEALGQTPSVQGVADGSALERYLVLSKARIDPADLEGLTIGCLDLVGRKRLPTFVTKVLGLSGKAHVRRVTKVEDLLQLLQFDRADAILLPERFLEDLQARSKLDFEILKLPQARVERMAVAFPGQRGAVEQAIRQLPTSLIRRMGVETWR